MPNPTLPSVHVNRLLTDMSIQYVQDVEGFVGHQICPMVSVQQQSNRYTVWSKADFLRLQAQDIGDGDPAPIAGYKVDTTPFYSCQESSLKKMLTKQQKANYDKPLNADRAMVNFLTQQLLMKRDSKVLAKLMVGSSAWATEYQGVNASPSTNEFLQWDDTASTPFADVRKISTSIKLQCGRRPNKLCVTSDVDDFLQEHPKILDKIKYTGQGGFVDNAALARAFGVKEYLVSDSIYNTAAENLSSSNAFMQTKKALLVYVPDAPSLEEPSACYNFVWSEFDGLKAGTGAALKRWPEQDPEGEWFRGGIHMDPKITARDAGGYLYDVIP